MRNMKLHKAKKKKQPLLSVALVLTERGGGERLRWENTRPEIKRGKNIRCDRLTGARRGRKRHLI